MSNFECPKCGGSRWSVLTGPQIERGGTDVYAGVIRCESCGAPWLRGRVAVPMLDTDGTGDKSWIAGFLAGLRFADNEEIGK